jgi:hypothetical protein
MSSNLKMSSPASSRASLPSFDNSSSKVANCLRKRSNWAHILPEHKFDKNTFDRDAVLLAIEKGSPKMKALLDKIREVDARDTREHGRRFKHFIFSEVPGGYGAKIIASSLLASGMVPVYTGAKHQIKSDAELLRTAGNNFALLCSNTVYGEPLATKTKKQLFAKYNQRPENIHGELIRFAILDSGFKEGVDLFDVKYVHIFEPQTSRADQKQAIGRATRTCGQMGLDFHPKQGWPLHVFEYDVEIDEDAGRALSTQANSLFEFYLENSNIDKRILEFADELEKYTIIGSVDYNLNKNVHRFKIEASEVSGNDFWMFQSGGVGSAGKKKEIKCSSKKCGKVRPTKEVPAGLPVMILAAIASGKTIPNMKSKTAEKKPREVFCEMLNRDPHYCEYVQMAFNDPVHFAKAHRNVIVQAITDKVHLKLPTSPRSAFLRFIRKTLPKEASKILEEVPKEAKVEKKVEPEVKPVEGIPPPREGLSFVGMQKYIADNYSQFTWDKITLKNDCGTIKKSGGCKVCGTDCAISGGSGCGVVDLMKGGASLVKLTPTQNFVKEYFTPQNPNKGLLLWHSVGTGKTAAAIATASTHFEKEGYTILWVTRTTLKNDIWKNMFDQVASTVIAKLVREGKTIPADHTERMRLLSKSWSIRPMSYKQFTNLIEGKNKLCEELVKKNGQKDPLRKTLLIIDEAHKLYGGDDLSSIERPNMEKLAVALRHSYQTSGDESVKVMLMTATPYTNDPFEMIKLINLFKPVSEELPTNYEKFADKFLHRDTGHFTKKGKMVYLNAIAGLVSYLNRERDARQFAQPMMHKTMIPLAEGTVDELNGRLLYLKEEERLIKADAKEVKVNAKEEIKGLRATAKANAMGMSPVRKADLAVNIKRQIVEIKKRVKDESDQFKRSLKEISDEIKKTKLRLEKEKKVSQLSVIEKECLDKGEGEEIESVPRSSSSVASVPGEDNVIRQRRYKMRDEHAKLLEKVKDYPNLQDEVQRLGVLTASKDTDFADFNQQKKDILAELKERKKGEKAEKKANKEAKKAEKEEQKRLKEEKRLEKEEEGLKKLEERKELAMKRKQTRLEKAEAKKQRELEKEDKKRQKAEAKARK